MKRISAAFPFAVLSLFSLASRCNAQGSVSDAGYSSLAAACASAGKAEMLLTRAWSGLPNGTKLDCNIHALVGGIIQPAAGATVTLSGSFDGELARHFDLSLGGKVVASSPSGYAVLYPQWWGATGNGRTVVDGSMPSGGRTLISGKASFTTDDVGDYVSVSGCGESTTFPVAYRGGLGTTIVSVTNSTTAVLAAHCNTTGISGATVTLGTNDYAAIADTAAAASSWSGVKSVLFPPRMYVIGQHKTKHLSCVDPAEDIHWKSINGMTISGTGATIYVDASFSQAPDCGGGKSDENTITPFLIQNSSNFVIQGFTILGNKDLIVRSSGVNSESLTSFCVAAGGPVPSTNYVYKDMSCSQPQSDCFFVSIGIDGKAIDTDVLSSNLTCTEPGRGNYSEGSIQNWHLSAVHASDACRGNYGGYMPCHGLDIEPDQFLDDNIIVDGGSTFTNDLGYELVCGVTYETGHVTIKDSHFSWNVPGKGGGLVCGAQYLDMENNTFAVGVSASSGNVEAVVAPVWSGSITYAVGRQIQDKEDRIQVVSACASTCMSGAQYPAFSESGGKTIDNQVTWTNRGPGVQSQIWKNNQFVDTTGIANNTLFSSGYVADGTPGYLDMTGNSFMLNGLTINARNIHQFAGNHIFWKTTGSEKPGVNVVVNLEGSQSVHDNDYNTDLKTPGKSLRVFYKPSGPASIGQSNEHYLSPAFQPSLSAPGR